MEFNLSKQKHHHLPSWGFATSADACIVGNQPCTHACKLIQLQLFKSSLDEAKKIPYKSPVCVSCPSTHQSGQPHVGWTIISAISPSSTSASSHWDEASHASDNVDPHCWCFRRCISIICYSMAISKQIFIILKCEVDMCVWILNIYMYFMVMYWV